MRHHLAPPEVSKARRVEGGRGERERGIEREEKEGKKIGSHGRARDARWVSSSTPAAPVWLSKIPSMLARGYRAPEEEEEEDLLS